jgi:hypothetical protein
MAKIVLNNYGCIQYGVWCVIEHSDAVVSEGALCVMYHILYQSYSVGTPSPANLKTMLQQSWANNMRLNITGLLLYGNGNYLQVLEGEEKQVKRLFEIIRNDRRHFSVEMLSGGPIPMRVFHDRPMAFQELANEDFDRLMRYIDSYHTGLQQAHSPEIDEGILLLLKSFTQNPGSQR